MTLDSTALSESQNYVPKKVGYARVSRDDQNLDMQKDALSAAGCSLIFEDHGVSGARSSRPGLDAALSAVQTGDTLIVWKLDRLGRSTQHLLGLVTDLTARGIVFVSLRDSLTVADTGLGKFFLTVLAAIAELERDMIRERTCESLAAKRRRGEPLGRRRALTPDQIATARELIESGKDVRYVARLFKCGRSSVYRALDRERARHPEGDAA